MAKWITVANRLPFSLSKDGKTVTQSSGGLVSALSGVKSKGEKLWVGCAPDNLTPDRWTTLQDTLSTTSNGWQYQPVYTDKALYESYYDGLCNDVLWPLLHYQTELVEFSAEAWNSYRTVNEKIANEIAAIAEDDDLVWIHDYHLFLVPKMLKALRPNLRVGFFLHVPFPSHELFRQLPVREEILTSLLDADLIGFHDYSYLQHFCNSVLRILGLESQFLTIRRGNKVTRLGVFPVSIDTENFVECAKTEKVEKLLREMEKPYFTFLGVDRLDYMKGLDLKLEAYRTLLRRNPQYKEKVVLLQVAVPTRQGVPVYAKLARDTARLVGEINGEFSTPTWSPVHYIHASVNFNQLLALYRSSDALLVSSKRDGMNLVALEYIASQGTERPGVVLLSEFAGASSTLSHTLSLNPWDLEDTAKKMQLAMEMPNEEKLSRLQTMQKYLDGYTATDWAESFITELEKHEPVEAGEGPCRISTDPKSLSLINERLSEKEARKLIVFLDYDGTVVPIESSPELAVLTPQSKKLLQQITRYPWLDLVIVSGRDSRFLEKQFEGLPVRLVAEHGAKELDPASGRWQRLIHRSRTGWYPPALKIMSDYMSRVPNSQIEKKHFAIAWHYRKAPQDYAEIQAKKLAQELELGLANLPVSILRGKKVIEVRAIEADKGVFAGKYLNDQTMPVAALALGDDRTDEDLFHSVKSRGVSVKVGSGASSADFCLRSQTEVLEFLKNLMKQLNPKFASGARSSGTGSGVGLPIKHVLSAAASNRVSLV